MTKPTGKIVSINGPVIKVDSANYLQMYELVRVGNTKLSGEVIEIIGDIGTIQVYEDTYGLKPGEPYISTGSPLSAELGPGLIQNIFDGILRPLKDLEKLSGVFIGRGAEVLSLNRNRLWEVKTVANRGQKVNSGDVIAEIQETSLITHKIMVPPGIQGEIVEIVSEGMYNVDSTIAMIKTKTKEIEIKLYQRWPIRKPRPVSKRLIPTKPLITGQRVIDTFFPITKGGTAAIPGGFGTGKTVTQHQLAKWCEADIIVYVGCGERGNEMTEVLEDFPKLIDPKSGKPLMERTILIANTSNMPVAARGASIYSGIALAEYYRDMGYDVALMADSSSRWAEALRELSGRLEEMPAEEGYPAYLGSRLAEFYERAGAVKNLNNTEGSVTVIAAVSPAGGDFSEPVTMNTKRYIRCFWGLDRTLASARHYPAINWLESYSEYRDSLFDWWSENVAPEWKHLVQKAMQILQEEDELQQIVKLVGEDVLADNQKLILRTARLIKVGFLQQASFDPVDTYCPVKKQYKLLEFYLHYHNRATEIIAKGAHISNLETLKINDVIYKLKNIIKNDDIEKIEVYRKQLDTEMDELKQHFE